MIKRFVFVVLLAGFFISVTGCITAMEWSTRDEDDDEYIPPKKVAVEKKKNSEKKGYNPQFTDEEEEIPDIYEAVVDMPYEEADLLLRSALEEENFKIIKVSHVTKGMEEQGRKDFWKDMNIYLVCKLSDGYFVLRHNPQLVGFCPYRVYTYRNKDGLLVIGMVKPSMAVRYMGNPDLKAIEILKKHDFQLKRIIDEITSK
ncbi:Uncharacterized conserved protein, DUF302 family [Persephonella hydrogeniphila]|uniref:Uncharacterized conserved protein, DUF302 family n=1 Tax=Persephonella hydrogeniphila TaxID=198703 RepID=A0A285NC51_9AQUI|nr:DUF302 domain-containing protein [Persephonella hydrogeniphila]SNZ06858.1 Uncharacterized conserved protein, DUF302 family [Persephonella hydrogeniphila]